MVSRYGYFGRFYFFRFGCVDDVKSPALRTDPRRQVLVVHLDAEKLKSLLRKLGTRGVRVLPAHPAEAKQRLANRFIGKQRICDLAHLREALEATLWVKPRETRSKMAKVAPESESESELELSESDSGSASSMSSIPNEPALSSVKLRKQRCHAWL